MPINYQFNIKRWRLYEQFYIKMYFILNCLLACTLKLRWHRKAKGGLAKYSPKFVAVGPITDTFLFWRNHITQTSASQVMTGTCVPSGTWTVLQYKAYLSHSHGNLSPMDEYLCGLGNDIQKILEWHWMTEGRMHDSKSTTDILVSWIARYTGSCVNVIWHAIPSSMKWRYRSSRLGLVD